MGIGQPRREVVVRRPRTALRRSGCPRPQKLTTPAGAARTAAGLRILIADRSLLARRRLRRYLAETEAISEIVEVDSVTGALSAIARVAPHVLFVDADLPGGSRFAVPGVFRTESTPAIIWMSADAATFRRDALRLRKPVAGDTVRALLAHARRRVEAAGGDLDRNGEAGRRRGIPGRLLVRSAGRVFALPVEQ